MTFPVAILAGGLGTRLAKLTENSPKVLIPVNGKPFIQIQLELLVSQGVKEVVICLSHLGERIESLIRNLYLPELTISYSYDSPHRLGTGGAIRKALPLLGETFAVLFGDSYLEIDFIGMCRYFEDQNAVSMMTYTKNITKDHISNIRKESENLIYYDKNCSSADMDFIDFGITFFKKSVFENYQVNYNFDLSQLLNDLSKSSELIGYGVENNFFEIGSIKGIEQLENYLINKK